MIEAYKELLGRSFEREEKLHKLLRQALKQNEANEKFIDAVTRQDK